MANDVSQLHHIIRSAIEANTLTRIVLSRPLAGSRETARRIDIRTVQLRGRRMYQWTRRTGHQEIHENQDSSSTLAELSKTIGTTWRSVRVVADSVSWTARFSRRGRCRLWVDSDDHLPMRPEERDTLEQHDRHRHYILQEGRPVPFLTAVGVMSEQGHVRRKYFRKFRQINRFVEFIADTVPHLPEQGTLDVVDFGCGRSYLTFATHHYLTQIAKRSVNIVGLDRRTEIVRRCRNIAERLELDGIRFESGDITNHRPQGRVHLAVALHACDTATDDALVQAVRWSANVILAVPCCQHELAAKLPGEVLSPLTKHGVLRERFCSDTTDAMRAALLEQVGYHTKVMEFIDMEHTAKNILIRAVRRTDVAPAQQSELSRLQLHQLQQSLRIPPLQLERELRNHGLLATDGDS